jgi:hypothetical protein
MVMCITLHDAFEWLTLLRNRNLYPEGTVAHRFVICSYGYTRLTHCTEVGVDLTNVPPEQSKAWVGLGEEVETGAGVAVGAGPAMRQSVTLTFLPFSLVQTYCC